MWCYIRILWDHKVQARPACISLQVAFQDLGKFMVLATGDDTMVVDGDVRIRLAPVNARARRGRVEETTPLTRSACLASTTVVYDVNGGRKQGTHGRIFKLVWCSGYDPAGPQSCSTHH